jgi:hypothetical protein
MKKHIDWCKKHFFGLSALFLLAFVPLYPKLPLFDIVQTWVYVRLEDLLIAGVLGMYVVSKVRARQVPKTYLTWPIAIYWIVGLVSSIVSIVWIGPTLMTYAPHLTVLHFLRRIEYMMLFFVAFEMVITNKRFFTYAIWTLAVTVLLISLYSAGQKFLGFPAFLTMNEEFAKGVPLRLPPTARIPSTFGGHYDLAAYMVLVIPILGSLVFAMKQWWQKLLFIGLSTAGLITLLFTASRISFGVYLAAITTMLIWQKKKLLIIPVVVASMVLLNSVSSASERFYKTFRYSDVIVDLSTGKPIGTLDRLEGGTAVLENQERPDVENLPKGSEFIGIGTGSTSQADNVEIIAERTLASGSGEIATVSGSFLIQKALVYDISITTRFQGQWPKAIEAFKRNMLLGSGFSTLSVAADGDYFRMLGETGVIGAIAFLSILGVAFGLFLRKKESLPAMERAFVIGVFAGIVGLLLNAVLIDVFEASKVAYTLWLLLGIAMAILTKDQLAIREYLSTIVAFFTKKVMVGVYICLFTLVFHSKSLGWYFMGDDFTWLRWAAESTVADISGYFTQAAGFFWRPIPKLWYFLLYSVFWLKPAVYHFFSLLFLAVSALCIWGITLAKGVRPWLAFLGAILFVSLSVHHENVYWVSGQSSLLASVFLLLSLYVWQCLWLGRVRASRAMHMLAILCLVLSMLSYDGMMIAPILVWVVGVFAYGQRPGRLSVLLLLVPLYWYVRQATGAVLPSGDYGYKLVTLLPNILGNVVGYVGAFLGGPQVIEYMDYVRGLVRTNRLAVTGVALVALFGGMYVLNRYGRNTTLRTVFAWIVAGFFSLSAYIGLGGMAERYVFVASALWMIALVHAADIVCSTRSMKRNALIVAIALGLIAWNMWETKRLQEDWQQASSVTERTILTIKKQYFPLDNYKAFVMVNMPTRIGRAWIFPTGFEDALWHMFRLNDHGYAVYRATTVAEALQMELPVRPGRVSHEVLVFEQEAYNLRRVTKEHIQASPEGKAH